MVLDSGREQEEFDLEVIRGRSLCTFLSDNYYRDTFPILEQHLDVSITCGRTKPSDSTYDAFEVISDEIRNAMDHASRASVIDSKLLVSHQTNRGAETSERWISSYLERHQTIPPARTAEIVEQIIHYEIAMAVWHLNLAKMRALIPTTDDMSKLLDEISAYAETKGKRNGQKIMEKHRLDRVHDDNTRTAKKLMDDLEQLSSQRRQPNEQEIIKTETVVVRQVDTLNAYADLMRYWRNDPPVPSLRQIRREMRNRDAMRWLIQRSPLLVVTLLMLIILARISGFDILYALVTLVSGILIGALGNDVFRKFFGP